MLALAALLLHGPALQFLGADDQNSGDESESLAGLQRHARGEALYRDFRQAPHLFTSYTPWFFVVPGSLARGWGLSTPAVFAVGRGYVFVCWLGIGLLLYLVARQAGAGRWPSVVAGLLWLAAELAPAHAVSFRPDGPQLFYSLAAIWIGWRATRSWQVLVCAGLLVTAFMTKQSAVVPLGALLLEFGHQRRWRHAMLLAATWAGLLAALLIHTQWRSGGLFWLNAFQALAVKASAAHVGLVLSLALTGGLACWLGALGGLLSLRDQTARFWQRYFLLAVLVGFAGSWKFGSAPTYYLEALMAGTILCALWLSGTGAGVGRWRAAWGGVVLASTLMVCGKVFNRPQRPVHTDWAAVWACIDARQPVLVEHQYLAIRGAHNPYLLNPSLLNAFRQAGQFDDTPILQAIGNREFESIVTTAPLDASRRFRHFPPHWLALIGQQYVLARTCGPVYVYQPRPANR